MKAKIQESWGLKGGSWGWFRFPLKWSVWGPWFFISPLYRPSLGCWGISCPVYSEFLIDARAPRRKVRSKRKGKVSLLPPVFHNCPRPPPRGRAAPLLFSLWVFPFLQNQPFLGQIPWLETTCCFKDPRKKFLLWDIHGACHGWWP